MVRSKSEKIVSATMLTELHRVTSPPAPEETLGVGCTRRCVSRPTAARRLLGRDGTSKVPQRALVTFPRWKVTSEPYSRAARQCETFPLSVGACQFSEPTVPTPHSLFVPPKRERAVDGTREKGGLPRQALRHRNTFPPQHCPAVSARFKQRLLRPLFTFLFFCAMMD